MEYADTFLERYGLPCTILRSPPVPSFVTMRRVSNSSIPATREAAWRGLILKESDLTSGDLFTVSDETFLVESTTPADGALEWFAVKCNATIEHQRAQKVLDEEGNLVRQWATLATTPVWGQIVTARLRQEDPGLVDNARYIFEIPKSFGVKLMDRFIYGGTAYQVESVDDVALPGVVRVQLGVDLR